MRYDEDGDERARAVDLACPVPRAVGARPRDGAIAVGAVLGYEPIIVGAVALLALIALITSLSRRGRSVPAPRPRFVSKGADKFVAEGRFEEAGRLAMIQNQWDEAVELYRMAAKPELAAAAARRAGKLLVAAELYDLAGDAENAEVCRQAVASRAAAPIDEPAAIPQAPRLPSLEPPLSPAVAVAPLVSSVETEPPPLAANASSRSTPPPHRSSAPLRSSPPLHSSPPLRSSPPRRSDPPEKSSYSIISEPPPRRRSGAPPRARLATQPLGSALATPLVSPEEVAALVAELTDVRAIDEPRTLRQLLAGCPAHGRTASAPVTGLESQPLDLSLLDDEAVWSARFADGTESLLDFVHGESCDLGNIEVFHRLGLAHLAHGAWDAALAAFASVDEASAGYRGADARVAALVAWHQALGPHLRGIGDGQRFELLGELGRSARSVVYRARDAATGAQVALKLFTAVLETDDAMLRFETAAHAAASLAHPDITTVHGHGFIEGRGFVTMDIVEGAPIDAVASALTVVEALEAMVTVLDALAYAHEGEVLHGAVHPSNVVVGPSGRVRLMDFAVTRAVAGGPAVLMAPEQLTGRPEDPRTDVFLAGGIAYQLLSGRLPFEGPDGLRPLTDVPAVAAVIDEAIQKALAMDPVARWPSAKAFSRPLETVIETVIETVRENVPEEVRGSGRR